VILYVAPEAGPARAAFVASKRVVATSVAEDVDLVFVAREAIRGARTQDLETEMGELLRRMGVVRS
jgi:hypothetical protein